MTLSERDSGFSRVIDGPKHRWVQENHLNAVVKGLGSEGVAAVQRWRIDHHDRVSCFGERFSWLRRVCGEQGGIALIRTHVAQRTEGQEYIAHAVLTTEQAVEAMTSRLS
jgi:hypothetical protein